MPSASFAGLFTPAFGNDGSKDADNNDVEDADAISYALGVSRRVPPAVWSTR